MSVGFVAGAGNSRVESRGGKLHRTLTDFKKTSGCLPDVGAGVCGDER
jgi:hypothetical protein